MQAILSSLIDIFLALIIGLALLQGILPQNSKPKILTLNRIFCILMCLTIVAYLITGTIEITQSSLSEIFESTLAVTRLTSFGQMALLALITSLIMLVINYTRPDNYKLLYLLAILVLAYAKAAIGHAADFGLTSIVVFIHTLHVLAGCAWAGSVAASIIFLPQWHGFNSQQSQKFAHRLSLIATIAVPITIVCGLADSIRILYFASNLWPSEYLVTLGVKILLVVIAVMLGLLNRWYWMPKMANDNGKSGFVQVITIESVALLLVLIAAGQLGFTMIPN